MDAFRLLHLEGRKKRDHERQMLGESESQYYGGIRVKWDTSLIGTIILAPPQR